MKVTFLKNLFVKYTDEKDRKAFLEVAKNLKFVSAKTADGLEVMVEPDLSEGAVIYATDGTPAPDGAHILEDGTKIEVKDGIITKIEAKVKEDMQAQFIKELFAEFKTELAAIKTELANAKTELAAVKGIDVSKFASVESFNELKESFSKFVDTLAFEKTPNKFVKQRGGDDVDKPMAKHERIAAQLKEG